MTLPSTIIAMALKQHGAIARRQLLSAGVDSRTVDTWVARGTLLAVHRGVYRLPGSPNSTEQRLWCALLRSGDGARVTGWSAVGLYGLEGLNKPTPPWIVVPPDRRVRGVDFVVQRARLRAGEKAATRGIATVTPTRALIDAAIRFDDRRVRVAVDDAGRKDMVRLERLLHDAQRLPRHRGAARIRRLFGDGAFDQESELERKLALLLAEADLWPLWGVEVLPNVTVDACFPEASYVLEVDSRRWHTIEADRAADVSREALLRYDSWRVDRITDEDLERRPQHLVTHVRAHRTARMAAGLGRKPGWSPVSPGRRIRPPR